MIKRELKEVKNLTMVSLLVLAGLQSYSVSADNKEKQENSHSAANSMGQASTEDYALLNKQYLRMTSILDNIENYTIASLSESGIKALTIEVRQAIGNTSLSRENAEKLSQKVQKSLSKIETKANKELLLRTISQANIYSEMNYTDESYKVFRNNLAKAQKIYSTEGVGQKEVETAQQKLIDSINKLKKDNRPKKVEVKKQTLKPVSKPAENKTTNLNSVKNSNGITSQFNGYALQPLSSYSDKSQGAIVYSALNQIGTQGDIEEIYQSTLGISFGTNFAGVLNIGNKISVDQIQPGDLIFTKAKDKDKLSKVGIYMGEDMCLVQSEKTHVFEMQDISDSPEIDFILHLTLSETMLTPQGREILDEYPVSEGFQISSQTQEFINKIGGLAGSLGEKYGIYPSVMIAQAILESGSGTSDLSLAPNNNLFGVKGAYYGSSVNFSTYENNGVGNNYIIEADFKKYPDLKASLEDYAKLIRYGISGNSSIYGGAWKSKSGNYLKATQELTGKYATDTNYNKKLNALIALYNLTKFDINSQVSSEENQAILDKSEIPDEYKSLMKFPVYDGINYNISGSYPFGQCTYYVYNRIKQLGGEVGLYMGNGGDWGNTAYSTGYQLDEKPTAGDIISFRPGIGGSDTTYGHVAFVEAVTSKGILISEMNVLGEGKLSYRVLSNDIAYSTGVSYIIPKK